jgi:hypothetical protein
MELLQHGVVTLAALGAAWVIVRRVFTAVAPGPSSPQCASCPAAHHHTARPAPARTPERTTHPLILVKKDGR